MREAIGQTFLINIIVLFIIIFIILFAGSTSYTKAYKVKNRIISILEEEKGYTTTARQEIDNYLSSTGYKVVPGGKATCNRHYANNNASQGVESPSSGYRYCIETFVINRGTENERTFYGVTAFMYFEIPVISSLLELPVYGETKQIGILGN